MALRQTETLVPIRSQAESLRRRLITCVENVNKTFSTVFVMSDPEANLPEKIYLDIWRSLRGYLCDLTSDVQINEIMVMFDNYKSALPGCYIEFNRLPEKKKDVFYALIDFYKVLAIQCFILRQLSSLGGNLHEIEHKSRHALLQAKVDYIKARDQGGKVKYKLSEKIAEIEKNLSVLARDNSIVSSYTAMLNEEVDQFEQNLIERIDVFRHEFHAFIRDFQHFSEKYADFRQRRAEALRAQNQATLGNMRESRLNEIKHHLKTLALHLKTINSKNIFTFENDLQHPNGTLAEINLLADTLAEFHKTQKDKEAELNAEETTFLNEFAVFQQRLRDLQDPEKEFAKKVSLFYATLTHKEAEKYLTRFHHIVDMSKFSVVQEAEPAYTSLRRHEYELLGAENTLQASLRNNKEIVKEVCAAKSLVILQEIKRTQNLAASLKHRKDVSEAFLAMIDQQYSDFYALISTDEQNLKIKWLDVTNVVKETLEKTDRDIQSLQEAINHRSRDDEIHAISHSIEHLSDDIHRDIRETQNLRMLFTEISGKYEKIKHMLADAVRAKLEEAYINAGGAIARAQQEAANDINALYYEVKNYSFPFLPDEQKVKLIDDKQIKLLMSEVQHLRAAYEAKVGMLKHAQAHRDETTRRRELEEIEQQTRQHSRPSAHLPVDNQQIKSASQKPGFFRRHWQAITATTTAFALTGAALGAGAGVAAAVFSTIPTLGLGMIAIPLFTVAGFALGALTGLVLGVAGSLSVEHCCVARRTREENMPINHRRQLLTTANIQERLHVEHRPQQPVSRTPPTPLDAKALGIRDIEEIAPVLPPLQIEQRYAFNHSATSLAK